mgnify:CR=1 FL=1
MIVPDTMRTAEPGKLRGRIRFRVGQEPEPGFPADLQDEPDRVPQPPPEAGRRGRVDGRPHKGGEAADGTGTLPVWGSGAKRPGRRRQPACVPTSSQTESKIRTGSPHGLLRECA